MIQIWRSLFTLKRSGENNNMGKQLQPFYHFVSSVINVYVLYSDLPYCVAIL